MIRSFGCSWLRRQPWTTASSDHARRRSRGRGGAGAIVSIGSVWSGRCRWARRSRPGPPDACPVIRASRGVPPVHLDPSPSGAGWVGCTTEPWGCVGGRTRLGARLFSTRPPRFGCHATGCGPDPPHPALLPDDRGAPSGLGRGQVRDQQERGTSCRGCGSGPDPADHAPASRGGQWARTGPQPVKWHPYRRWSRPERACPRVGDGCPRNHMIR
jgi:hypothetical protein